MDDPETLATRVAATVVADIVKGGSQALIQWVKRRCRRKTVEAVDTLAADPRARRGGAKKVLEGSLEMDLKESPALADELRSLLDQRSAVYGSQTAIATCGSTITQIQGNDNRSGPIE